MSTQLITAIVSMLLALTFYTLGVFGEKKQGTLRPWHAAVFWLGFVCDSTGTGVMGKIAGAGAQLNLHSVTGAVALLLMAFHALWATVILVRKQESAKATFHRFSILVWSIWLIPFVLGMFIGMRG